MGGRSYKQPWWEGEGKEGSCACSEVLEVDALGVTGQDDSELVAGPYLADQGLRQVELQSSQHPSATGCFKLGPSPT